MSLLTLFAGLGRMYAWATPERLLDMPVSQLQAYYRAGLEHEQVQATVLVNRIADLLAAIFGGTEAEAGPPPAPAASEDDIPDVAAIERLLMRQAHRREGI